MILLGLGSNLGDREQYIATAVRLLAACPALTVCRTSALYETEPVGVKEQPAFLNAVISIKTTLEPEALLEQCLAVEAQLGRIRQERWGPRTIDIDLLLYENRICNSPRLSLPHPRLAERKFVLIPLAEVAGDIPAFAGKTAKELLTGHGDDNKVTYYKQLVWKQEG